MPATPLAQSSEPPVAEYWMSPAVPEMKEWRVEGWLITQSLWTYKRHQLTYSVVILPKWRLVYPSRQSVGHVVQLSPIRNLEHDFSSLMSRQVMLPSHQCMTRGTWSSDQSCGNSGMRLFCVCWPTLRSSRLDSPPEEIRLNIVNRLSILTSENGESPMNVSRQGRGVPPWELKEIEARTII